MNGGLIVKDPRLSRRLVSLSAGLVSLVVLLAFGIMLGSVDIDLNEILRVLFSSDNTQNYRIIYFVRTPRVLTGALVGLNMAISGCILQGILRNPLADPGIVGVSAGAGVAAVAVMVLYPEHSALVPIVAFFGALLAVGVVFLLSWENGIQPLRMILAGVAVSAFFGALMSAIMVFNSDKIQGAVNWMAGGFQGRSWQHVNMILPYSAVGLLGALFGYRQLNALQLGDEVAKSIGTRVEAARFLLVVLAALLAASAVSVAGMIGFVGLIVPHIMRLFVGSDFEFLLPCSALFGGALVVGADTVARTAFSPVEVPVGIFMALLGAPFFLYLLKKGMSRR
jgi:iron complex transport system permease protein